ncbi:hypothetical protein NGB36_18145 [Streptomyces sp. RB6PN25]|uniref:Integral membrane protein n=1 Tax=Streptomyces humicola TaxID=2953240 RepID=A0ABT1PXQ5_9ACTN|nr:hypothetical protein [Streptomyces humicola]MCQ4082470.1 hypothetical protein [Streptomyces humicola]
MSEHTPSRPAAVEVHHPTPVAPAPQHAASLVPQQAGVPAVQSVQLPDGRIVTGYALTPAQPPLPEQAPAARSVVSPVAVNIALTGVGFAAVCGGLLLLTGFIAALAAFIHQLIILAAVIFGGAIAVQVFAAGRSTSGTTVHIRKAVIKRNHFHT